MAILLCKLALAPAFVVVVSIAIRRFGPRVGGLLGGLPVVAGPILLVYGLEHGRVFVAEAAVNSLKGLVALTGFVAVVAAVAARSSLPRRAAVRAGAAVLAGWVAFCVAAGLLTMWRTSAVVALLACAASFVAAHRLLPAPDGSPSGVPRRPQYDLLLRAGAAAALVFTLTSLAGALGPTASGVLAPFPIITSVLAGFSVAYDPPSVTLQLLRNMLRGFFSFAAFLAVISWSVRPFGIGPAFALALLAAGAVQGLLLVTTLPTQTERSSRRRSTPRHRSTAAG